MAFVLGALVGLPTVFYAVNEVKNTINDITSFDYSTYFENKISNANLKTQICILEMELSNINKKYTDVNSAYKLALKSGRDIVEISNKRVHIVKLRTECKNKIKKLKSQLSL